jgi:hypothetical protein
MLFHPLSHMWRSSRRYLDLLEKFIFSLREEITLNDNEIKDLLSFPEKELDYDLSFEEVIENIETFPAVLRRTAFLTIFILLETNLNNICDHLQSKHKCPFSVYDLKGSGITRAANFINSTHGFEIKKIVTWPELCRFQEIRNILVHLNGKMTQDQLNEPVGKYICGSQALGLYKNDPQDEGETSYVINIKNGFCEHATDIVESFFNSIPEELFESKVTAR